VRKQGCTIGCKVCTGNGSRIPNADHCPDLPKPAANVTLDPMYRTTNQHTKPGSKEDFWKFNPWRAPGQAPVRERHTRGHCLPRRPSSSSSSSSSSPSPSSHFETTLSLCPAVLV
jgi:hypothetical protein